MAIALVFFSSLFNPVFSFYTDFLRRSRINRHCHRAEGRTNGAFLSMEGFEDTKLTIALIFISGLLFFLIFLGIIKGLIGLFCWKKIGEYGLNLLLELPRPLPRYQEKSLEQFPVVYDVGGWPVHPTTLQRTVRVVPKRTEFCLNMIFFLACPIAGSVYVCSLCCCIRNYKSKDDVCFTHLDVVKLNKASNGNDGPDMYKEASKEEQDTKYVIEVMKKSKESIHSLNGK